MAPPDIILFLIDQCAAKWLEAPAVHAIPTPNLDRLRAQGTTFTRTIVSNPVCGPARATLATGLTARGHGVLQNGYALDPQLPTFMRTLQQGGWRTGGFGKLHFQPHGAGLHPDYRPYGFDVVHNTEDARGGEWLDWIEREHPAHFEAALATCWAHWIPEFSAYGPERVDLASRIRKLRATFPWATPEDPDGTADSHVLPLPAALSQTAWITAHARDFLRSTPRDQPLFAQISYVQPHGPSCPPREALALVDEAKIPRPIPPVWPADPRHPVCFEHHGEARRTLPDHWRAWRRHFWADLAHLDQQLGLVLDEIAATRDPANTVILFLADHGDMLMDHGFTGKGEYHYDACIRVPLTIAGPGLPAGATCPAFVQLEDLCPTILDLTGLPPPALPVVAGRSPAAPVPLAGRSLGPLLRGPVPADWRSSAYVESYNNVGSHPRHWARTLRTATHRYTLYPEGQGEQLFDLINDPDESRNLAGDPTHQSLRQELRDALLDRILLQDYPPTPRGMFAFGVH